MKAFEAFRQAVCEHGCTDHCRYGPQFYRCEDCGELEPINSFGLHWAAEMAAKVEARKQSGDRK